VTMPSEHLSVLVVDDEPEVLTFFARVLDSNHIRALLARTPAEAVRIAERGYVPIDLILTDVSLQSRSYPPNGHAAPSDLEPVPGRDLIEAIRQIRPDVPAMQMHAWIDAGVIRISFVERQFETTSKAPDDEGLIESVRRAATEQMVRHAGGD